jgi:hypothetical protein
MPNTTSTLQTSQSNTNSSANYGASNSQSRRSKSELLFNLISDGRRHNIGVLARRLGSPESSVRGRLSELRTTYGFVIVTSNGFVQLVE